MATALFESLLMNHPFVDGNKRVAFFATDVFLRLNGWRLEVEADAAHGYLVGLLEGASATSIICSPGSVTRWCRAKRAVEVT